MSLISGNMDLICRTCLTTSSNMKSIYVGDGHHIYEMLLACSGIPIHELDGFPCNICSECLNKVYISYEFQQLCKISHKALINLIETKNNKEVNYYKEMDNRFVNHATYITDESNSSFTVDLTVDSNKKSLELDDTYHQITENHNDDSSNVNNIRNNSNQEKYVISSGSDVFIINFKDDDESYTECSNRFENEITEYDDHNESDNKNSTRLDLKLRKTTHLSDKSYYCELCNRNFSRSDHKIRHMQKHLKIKPFKCDECQVAFTRSDNLLAHRRKIHDKETSTQPEVCEICYKTFPTLQHLNLHIKVHLPVFKNWKCKYCNQLFNSKEDRNNHQNKHLIRQPTIGKQFVCTSCEQSFKSKRDYYRHRSLMHVSKTWYDCDLCDRTFTRLELRNRHVQQHFKVRPYKCDECGSEFTRRDNLRRHRENRHNLAKTQNSLAENETENHGHVNDEDYEIF